MWLNIEDTSLILTSAHGLTSHLPVLAGSLDLTLILVLHWLQAQLPVDPCDKHDITPHHF